jgi:hypothetical protein
MVCLVYNRQSVKPKMLSSTPPSGVSESTVCMNGLQTFFFLASLLDVSFSLFSDERDSHYCRQPNCAFSHAALNGPSSALQSRLLSQQVRLIEADSETETCLIIFHALIWKQRPG